MLGLRPNGIGLLRVELLRVPKLGAQLADMHARVLRPTLGRIRVTARPLLGALCRRVLLEQPALCVGQLRLRLRRLCHDGSQLVLQLCDVGRLERGAARGGRLGPGQLTLSAEQREPQRARAAVGAGRTARERVYQAASEPVARRGVGGDWARGPGEEGATVTVDQQLEHARVGLGLRVYHSGARLWRAGGEGWPVACARS
mmetsp:Transcript_22135/g.56089  ORF Transcript_22135/g.56089 Transcript_22135/m.56089 type:complete len:201 (-) Transcript_22135:57-659(-)